MATWQGMQPVALPLPQVSLRTCACPSWNLDMTLIAELNVTYVEFQRIARN